jgi:cardiolipin synthase
VNIPNILTGFRFLMIPLFGYMIIDGKYLYAAIVFAVAGITDILDGYIARKYKMVTDWGKIADPLADKLLQLTALTLLTIKGMIPFQFILIVAAKECFMGIGTILVYKKKNLVVQANWYGKMATSVFFIAILSTIAIKVFVGEATLAIDIIIGIAIANTLIALFMYISHYSKVERKM